MQMNRMEAKVNQLFSRISSAIAYETGRPLIFVVSLAVVLLWLLSGPLFHYSDTWQLIINTATSVLTFLMVFVIQTPRIATAPPSRPSSTS